MKFKVTFIFENDQDVSVLGEDPIKTARAGYDLMSVLMSSLGDKATVESVELIEEEKDD